MARINRGEMDVSRVVADGPVPLADAVDSATGKPLTATHSPMPTLFQHPAGLSRQQRRAQERADRKGRRVA